MEARGQPLWLLPRCCSSFLFFETGFNWPGTHWPVNFQGPSVSISPVWYHKQHHNVLFFHQGFEEQTHVVMLAQQALLPTEISLQSLVQQVSSACFQFFTSKYSFRTYHALSIPRPQFYHKPVSYRALVCHHCSLTVSWTLQGATDNSQECIGIGQDFRGNAGYCWILQKQLI